MSSKEYFISQCVARTPCPGDCKKAKGDCSICKRTEEEILEWFQKDEKERRDICEQLLER